MSVYAMSNSAHQHLPHRKLVRPLPVDDGPTFKYIGDRDILTLQFCQWEPFTVHPLAGPPDQGLRVALFVVGLALLVELHDPHPPLLVCPWCLCQDEHGGIRDKPVWNEPVPVTK